MNEVNEKVQKPDETAGALPLSSLALSTSGFIARIRRTNGKGAGVCGCGGVCGFGGGGGCGFHTFVCATATLVQQTFKLHTTHLKHLHTHTRKMAKVET